MGSVAFFVRIHGAIAAFTSAAAVVDFAVDAVERATGIGRADFCTSIPFRLILGAIAFFIGRENAIAAALDDAAARIDFACRRAFQVAASVEAAVIGA